MTTIEEPQYHADPDHEGEWETGCHNDVSNEMALIQMSWREGTELSERVWKEADSRLTDLAKSGQLAGFKDAALAILAELSSPVSVWLGDVMGANDVATWRTELTMLRPGDPRPAMPPRHRAFTKEQKLDWFHYFWREFKRWRQDKDR